MRWIDLHLRRGETARAMAMLDAVRERALRSALAGDGRPRHALEAGTWLRLGDLDRAQARVEAAEAGWRRGPSGGDHAQTLVGAVRASLCLRRGDAEGAEMALARAYAAALETRDLPIMAMVAVTVAELAAAAGAAPGRGPARSARPPGCAAPTTSATGRSRRWLARGRAALGEDAFAAAYQTAGSWTGRRPRSRPIPARLRRARAGVSPIPGTAPGRRPRRSPVTRVVRMDAVAGPHSVRSFVGAAGSRVAASRSTTASNSPPPRIQRFTSWRIRSSPP